MSAYQNWISDSDLFISDCIVDDLLGCQIFEFFRGFFQIFGGVCEFLFSNTSLDFRSDFISKLVEHCYQKQLPVFFQRKHLRVPFV